MNKIQNYGPLVIRIAVGALFLTTGFSKLANPDGVIAFLGGLGFGAAAFWAWLLLLSEIVFGLLILLGGMTKLTVWPLVVILLVAIFKIYFPSYLDGQNGAKTDLLFHIVAMASLLSLFLTGAGALSLEALRKK